MLKRIANSFSRSAGTIVFGMEDGTVSVFGLILGVAATSDNAKAVLIAGASGAVAAAVSMMAGVYLDAETTRDQTNDHLRDPPSESGATALSEHLINAGLTPRQSESLSLAVANNPDAASSLLLALKAETNAPPSPSEQALWMLLASFFAAAIPILPFVILPIFQARIVSGAVTLVLLTVLGLGRAQIVRRRLLPTVLETVSIGVAAAAAGVGVSLLIDRLFIQ